MSDQALLLVVRVADALEHVERSWQLPCEWCRQPCWVDPEGLFGTDFVELQGLHPPRFGEHLTLPGRRRLCCIRCTPQATRDLGVDAQGVEAAREFAAKFIRGVEEAQARQRRRRPKR